MFIHAYGVGITFSSGSIGVAHPGWFTLFFQNIISLGLARIAVPLFFLVSGYLFFQGFQWSLFSYKAKLLSRVSTLLLPFLFWNILILTLVSIAQSLPATQSFFPDKQSLITSFDLYDYFDALLGLNRFPIAYQFWFIRDLMIMILLVPVIQLILKIYPLLFLILFAILWFLPFWPVNIPSSQAFFFFYTGSWLATSEKDLFVFDKIGHLFLVAYAIILLADILSIGQWFHGFIHRTGLILGIFSVLYVTKFGLSSKTVKSFLFWAANCSFFVFAVHEPLLTLSQKVVYKVLTPSTDAMVLLLYVTIPLFVICLSLLGYLIAKRIAPGLLKFSIGDR